MFDLPTVLTAEELLDKALGRAAKATVSKGRTREERLRNLAVARIQIAGHTISSTLQRYVRRFPSLDGLPPFYRELVHILVDRDALKKHLGAVDWAAGKADELTRDYARRLGKARPADLPKLRRQAVGRLSSVVHQVAGDLEALIRARIALRRLPSIDPEVPTIVVAGYPNVGKSALVRAVSTATPKVAEYPFTSQGVTLGHIDRDDLRYQILDTPGLLDRPMEERNPIERQAVAALAHLADAVVFLLDPTETCGYPLEDQLRLLETLGAAFPDIPILAADNKADLGRPGTGRLRISARTGQGLPKLLEAVEAALTSRVPGAAPRRGGLSRPFPSSPIRGP